MDFKDFGFDASLLEGIDAMNYTSTTPIQELAIPVILQGKDIIATAQTGTGKTAAFLLPIIHELVTGQHAEDTINTLILVPTRELAVQITQNLDAFSYFTPVSSMAIYGGGDGISYEAEKRALSKGADIVVCTPGRLISHLMAGYVRLEGLRHLVLDEADRMLDMGFHDDIIKIISYLPKDRQTLLFSATMPQSMRQLGMKITREPEEISISISKPPERIIQRALIVYEPQKIPMIQHLLKNIKFHKMVVFCSSKDSVKKLSRDLNRSGFKNEEIHSDLEQQEREQVLARFRSGRTNILIATDILSRGIDIEDIDVVINYDVPHDGEDYVHRIGRTARAETDGTAFTLVSEREQYKLKVIEDLLGYPVPKGEVPAALGATPEYNPVKRKDNRPRGGGNGGGNSGGGNKKKRPFRNRRPSGPGKPKDGGAA
ncbi:MAG TPA: DEAD/DEAH box helicase [Chitinophagales bacterium]|nr:DEAD/DEAH box helicase [Chitinophagales bacterium]HQO32721.1 DEAD/DEAH box helicase [Chitinophagales bacterium]HQO88684.1 DEAD/DEAH box helicase [Chitinophagales bacterium]